MLETSQRMEESLTGQRKVQALEERVARLEDAVSALQNTEHLEERVAMRVADRVGRPAGPSTTGILLEAGRRLLPAPTDVPFRDPRGAAWSSSSRQPWLVFDLYAEFRAIWWMFLDRRYRVSWLCRLVPPVFVCLLFMSWLFLGHVPLVGPVIEKLFDMFLVVLAYKALSREAARYLDALPMLSPDSSPHV